MGARETLSRRTPARATIRKRAEGGFQVVRGKALWLTATPAAGGLRVARGKANRWFLEKDPSAGGSGYVLRAGTKREAPEASRSTRVPLGAGRALAGAHLVTADGRVFAIMADVTGGMFRLMSWDGFGPYAKIASTRTGWTIEATPAGESLAEDAELIALLAAELLDGSWRERGE